MPESRRDRVLFFLGAAFIWKYFFWFAKSGLAAYFSHDDLLNLYAAWGCSVGTLVKANLLFWSSEQIRPLGLAWYRVMFHFAGFDPRLFHVVSFAILMANVFLTYSVARRLSSSREVGAIAALLVSYHGNFVSLYHDTGVIYDVLCYFFYFSAFLCYLRFRETNRPLNAPQLGGFLILYICALDSKEMAVTLPVLLCVYEFLHHRPVAWRRPVLLDWMRREARGVILAGLITLVFAVGKSTGEGSLLHHPGYRPVFSRFLNTNLRYLDQLFYTENWFDPLKAFVLWGALFAAAWWTKMRELKLAWFHIMLSVLPVSFLTARGAFEIYIPLFGWALYLATVLAKGSEYLVRKLSGPRGYWQARARAAGVFLCVAFLLAPVHGKRTGYVEEWYQEFYAHIRSVVDQMRQMHPRMEPGTRILFLVDPIRPGELTLTFLMRLAYRDNSIMIDVLGSPEQKSKTVKYDLIFDYKDGKLIEITGKPGSAALSTRYARGNVPSPEFPGRLGFTMKM